MFQFSAEYFAIHLLCLSSAGLGVYRVQGGNLASPLTAHCHYEQGLFEVALEEWVKLYRWLGFTLLHPLPLCLTIEEWVKGFTLLHSLLLCSDLLHLVSDPSRMGEAVVVPLDIKHTPPHRLRRAGRGGFLSPLQLQY